MVPVSAVILTYNSARKIVDVLEALQWCDEILIVDSGSSDNTIELAQKYTDRIIKRALTGFGEQKGFAVNEARNDWVFVVDSDEVVTYELREEILTLFATSNFSPAYDGYFVKFRFMFLGHELKYSGLSELEKLRLFNKKFGNYCTSKVHEDVIFHGNCGYLKYKILHYSYQSIHDYLVKFNSYTTLGAADKFDKDRHQKFKNRVRVFTSLPSLFLKHYILKRGFLDGYYGFLWSLCSAFYPVIKYAKLEELYSGANAKLRRKDYSERHLKNVG